MIGGGLYALQFDGAYTFATARNFSFYNSSVRTIEMWVKPFGSSQAPTSCSNSPFRFHSPTSNTVAVPIRQTLLQGIYDDLGYYSFSFGLITAPVSTYYSTDSFLLFSGSRNISNFQVDDDEQDYVEVFSDELVRIWSNVWTHVAVTLDSQNRITFYVNGIRAGTTPSPPIAVFRQVYLGGRMSSTERVSSPITDVFCGIIDEVRLWSVTLDQAQVQRSMSRRADEPTAILFNFPMQARASQVENTPSIIAYWDFNEGVGDVSIDRVSNHATLHLGLQFAFERPRWVPSDGALDNDSHLSPLLIDLCHTRSYIQPNFCKKGRHCDG